MVNGINSYSNMDIWRQQAQQRAAQWAQVGAQGQQTQTDSTAAAQTDSVAFGRTPQAQTDSVAFGKASKTQSAVAQPDDGTYKCTDGKDDGKIGFWNATGHVIKGAGKFLAGLVGFEWDADGKSKGWNGGKALKNLAIGAGIAAVCVLTAGTAVPAIIAGAGVAMAAGGVGKSAYRMYTAKTDADMKAACNDFGSDAMALGMSVVGAKAAMKQYNPSGNYSGIKGTWNAVKDSTTLGFKQGWNGVKASYKAYKAGGWTSVKSVATESWNGFKNTVKTNWTNATKNTNPTERVAKTQEKELAQIDKDIKKLQKEDGTPINDAARVKIEELNAQKQNIKDSYDLINGKKSFSETQVEMQKARKSITETETRISKIKEQLKTAKGDAKTNLEAQLKTENAALARAKAQLKVYERVTDAKVLEAKRLASEIEKVNKEANGENVSTERFAELLEKSEKLEAQQKALDFKLPDKANHKKYVKTQQKQSSILEKQQKAYDTAKANLKDAEKAVKAFKETDTTQAALDARKTLANAKKAVTTTKKALDNGKVTESTIKGLANATEEYGVSDFFKFNTPKAKAVINTFNEQYGTMHSPFKGNKVPFTNWTVPGFNYGNVGKGWAIAATGDVFGLSANNKDEVTAEEVFAAQASGMSPLQVHNYIKGQGEYAQATSTADVIGIDPAQYYQARKAEMATAQQAPQLGGQTLTPADWQMFDYQMKAYGIA